MKFSLSWLKKHLETDATLDEIVAAMVRVGLEVEEVDNPAVKLGAVTVAEITAAEPHPDADKLRVCQVNTKDGPLQIVCGAPNARAGIKVAFAPVGTYVPGIDVTLSKAKIRGVESHGMMCSASELELGDDHDGIIEAPADAAIGTPYVELIGADDPVIDFEVTPNRPDTNGVMGVARDLAAAGIGKLVTPRYDLPSGSFVSPQKIELDFDPDTANACPVFGGVYVRGVKNGPSPEWLQQALRSVGLRPINALVDITNYVSIDRARPLHVYDAHKLTGPIRARLAKSGENLEALDAKEYTLTGRECVIADDARVLGLGGIMGGTYSGASDETTEVFIECAYFDPTRTAKTGRALGIISDARYRFERGIDPQSIDEGLAQAVALVLDLCGGEVSQKEVAGAAPDGTRLVEFPPSEVKRLTGVDVPEAEMTTILTALDFEVDDSAPVWQVRSPSARPDIEGKADIVEEIARIKGFEALDAQPLPRLSAVEAPKYTKEQDRVRLVKRAIAASGYLEAVTWSFCDADHANIFGGGAPVLHLANPISSDLGVMRPTILPGLVAAAGRNADRGRNDIALFEVGPVYRGDAPDEQDMMAAGIRISNPDRSWSSDGSSVDVFTVKAMAHHALAAAGAKPENLMVLPKAPAYYHPGRSGAFCLGPKKQIAFFGELHPRVTKAMDVAGPIYAFEVVLTQIPVGKQKPTKTKPGLELHDLLALSRDFAFVVDEATPAQDVIKAAGAGDKKLISDVRLFDVYQGKGIEVGKKSLAIEVVIQPTDKTLTDEEIEAISEKVVAQVAKSTGGVLRS